MTTPTCIAAAQTTPRAGDVEANLAQHLELAQAAVERGARLVLFPELSLTGYELAKGPELAFTPIDARLAPLSALAEAHGVTLVVGAPTRLGERLHIGALIVTPDRGVDLYAKHTLGAFSARAAVDGVVPPPEADVFVAGQADPLVDLGGAQAAVGICADTGRPEHPAAAAGRGAKVYLASMFVIPSELEREADNLARAARTHAMTVLFANFGGPSGGLAGAGRSAAWSPTGERLAALGPDGPGLVLVNGASADAVPL